MSKFNELINSDQPLLVDFFAEWCGPCKTMAPILQDVISKLDGKARIIKVDIEKNAKAVSKYGIKTVPTLVVFKNGEIKWRHSGVISSNQLIEILQKFN